MAKFAFKSRGLKRAAVLRDQGSYYSSGLAQFFIKTFTSLGGTIVAEETYLGGDVDFQSQLQKINKKNPEFIFIPGYYYEAAQIARQARELGIKIPLMGGDGWDSESLIDIAGEAMEGSFFTNHYTLEDPREEVQIFLKNYEKRFGFRPDSQAAAGYDAARILFVAIKEAGTTEHGKLRDAIAKTKDHRGVTGIISINENRDAVKSAVVIEVQKGKFKYVETINP
jgi:branched-chain amino acid transport system substrate-binding protein